MKKLSLLLIVAFICSSNIAYSAEQEEYDYVQITSGEIAPFDGFLFTPEGIANVTVRMQTKIRETEIKKDEELKRVQTNLNSIIEGKDVDLMAKKTMYDMQLQAKQAAVDSLVLKEKWSQIKIVGAAVAGIAVGVLTGFICGKLMN